MVSGSEQKFLLGLGVRPENSQTLHLGALLVHFSGTVLPCRFISFFPDLKGQEESSLTALNAASYCMFFFFLLTSVLFTVINPVFVIPAYTEACTLASVSNYLHCPFKDVLFFVHCVDVKRH